MVKDSDQDGVAGGKFNVVGDDGILPQVSRAKKGHINHLSWESYRLSIELEKG